TRPKNTTTMTLRGSGKSIIGLRLTGTQNQPPEIPLSSLVLSLQTYPTVDEPITLKIDLGLPNDTPFNMTVGGELSARTRIASKTITYTVKAYESTITLNDKIDDLLAIAVAHSAWSLWRTNVLPLYVSRTDTGTFTVPVSSFATGKPARLCRGHCPI